MSKFLATIVMLGAGVGGVSFAAEDSLPGDQLYPVKIYFTENVKSALSLDPESDANTEAAKIGKRLEEAGKLALKGRLSQNIADKLDAQFQKHLQKMSEIADKLEEQGKLEAANQIRSRLESILIAHEEILQEITENALTRPEIKEIVAKVKNQIQTQFADNEELRIRIEDKLRSKIGPAVQTAAEGKLSVAENKLDEVESFVEKKSDTLSPEAKMKIDAAITAARNAITDGKTKLNSEQYAEAFLLFQKSIALSQQAKIMAAIHSELAEQDLETDNNELEDNGGE